MDDVTIGPCRLIHGDSYMLRGALTSADVAVTDPPYEIVMSGGGIGAKRQYTHDSEGFTDTGFDYDILSWFPAWCCFGTLKQVPQLISRVGDRRWMLVTWNKPNPTPLCGGNYLPDTEYIVHAWGKGMLFGSYHDRARFIVHRVGDVQDGTHPNEKPVAVVSKMVRLGSDAEQLVADPFMGSGTTGVACIREGRRFIGVEKERKYFDIACKRIEQAWQLKRSELPFATPHEEVQRGLFESLDVG